MGTYTTNKNLFMPTVGEQGWGTLVNGNFETIDTYLKPISLSGSTYTFTGNHVGNQSGGTISATSISNSGTSTFTGKITANGGIGTTSLTTSSTITSTGKITGNGGIGTTSLTASGNITSNGTISATKIKQTGAMTVTPGTLSTSIKLGVGTSSLSAEFMCILPISTHKYTGSVKISNSATSTNSKITMYYFTEFNSNPSSVTINGQSTYTISFTNCSVLYIFSNPNLNIGTITLS